MFGIHRASGVRNAYRAAAALPLVALAGTACSSLTGGTVATPTAAYVALGDSYTAGPLIPNQVGSPTLCLRSDHNYPALTAKAISAPSFTDVSCSGATTFDMTSSQSLTLGSNPPQFNALSSKTRLVTLGIGGNDIGFSSITLKCAELSFSNPTGSPCTSYYTAGGTDQLATTISATGPKIASAIQGIHKLAPNAKIFVLGYPDILPVSGNGCYPYVTISSGDLPYMNSVEKELNTMISEQAGANNAIFVDTYTSSIGHDACQPSGTKWVEGIIPTDLAAPVHPNALGMANDAAQLEAAIKTAGFTFSG